MSFKIIAKDVYNLPLIPGDRFSIDHIQTDDKTGDVVTRRRLLTTTIKEKMLITMIAIYKFENEFDCKKGMVAVIGVT